MFPYRNYCSIAVHKHKHILCTKQDDPRTPDILLSAVEHRAGEQQHNVLFLQHIYMYMYMYMYMYIYMYMYMYMYM